MMRPMKKDDPLYRSFPAIYGDDFEVMAKAVILYNPWRWGWKKFFQDKSVKANKWLAVRAILGI